MPADDYDDDFEMGPPRLSNADVAALAAKARAAIERDKYGPLPAWIKTTQRPNRPAPTRDRR